MSSTVRAELNVQLYSAPPGPPRNFGLSVSGSRPHAILSVPLGPVLGCLASVGAALSSALGDWNGVQDTSVASISNCQYFDFDQRARRKAFKKVSLPSDAAEYILHR